MQGILKRRRGYQLLSSSLTGAPFIHGYSFRSEIRNIRSVVYDSSTQVNSYSESGSSAFSIFTPSLLATYVPRMVLSRSYGYFADGARVDYVKWNGTANPGNLTNWGIQVSSTPAQVFGPSAPGTVTDVSLSSGPFVAVPWTNPNNIKVADGAFATVSLIPYPHNGGLFAGYASDSLQATNFGFAVSPTSAQITGIQVDVKGLQSQTTNPPNTANIFAWIIKNGTVIGPAKEKTLPLSNGFALFGGPSDSWGNLFFGSDVNASNFGVAFQVEAIDDDGNLMGNVDFSIDYVQMTIFVSGSTIVLGAPGAGGITLQSGRVYTIAFQNSTDGTVSDIYPFSSSTGPLSNNSQPLSGLPVSTDPQVDQKLLLATADGGDETTLFLITQIPNAATTYTDNMSDTQLLTQPVYQETQADGTLHGVANNKVPPLISFPTKHKGRIFGTIQNTLYFSKNLVDVTTSTGTITAKWEEAWPSTYQLDMSELAETVSGLLSDGETLWIGTEKHIRRLVGDSPANFQQPEIQFNNTGLYNQDTWQIVFSQGQPVGTMWLTPDFKVMGSDFNTYQDVGWPVQDILNRINRGASILPWAMFVSDGPAEYYMLHVPLDNSASPNTILVYDLDSKAWFVWQPSDAPTGGVFFFDVTGAPRWTFGSALAPIFEWKNNIFQDRVGLGTFLGTTYPAVSYSASARTSWLDFGDPTLRKALNQIIVGTGDSNLLVTLEGATLDSELDLNPQLLVSAVAVTTGPLSDLFLPLASAPTLFRWYRWTFLSLPSTLPDVLDFYNIEAIPLHRW